MSVRQSLNDVQPVVYRFLANGAQKSLPDREAGGVSLHRHQVAREL